ncbi:MAG: hypothetical protein ACOYLF_13930, partial [Blastocatellia bacterium]
GEEGKKGDNNGRMPARRLPKPSRLRVRQKRVFAGRDEVHVKRQRKCREWNFIFRFTSNQKNSEFIVELQFQDGSITNKIDFHFNKILRNDFSRRTKIQQVNG